MKRAALVACALLLVGSSAFSSEEDFYAGKRREMVEEQIRARGIRDVRVLDAMLKVERHQFVGQERKELAYEDRPLPIGYRQTISQPYIVAYMTTLAAIDPKDKVLEIGTGSGYQAAILAELADMVYTVEIVKPLADEARERLRILGYRNIMVKRGDGYKGWLEHAPFDKIIVTAAPLEIPEELVAQLKTGGLMVVPIGSIFQELYLIKKTAGGYKKEALLPVRFVPMVKGNGK
ncbi:MAG: protein-L-isoaspartate(D-aspartate) O-methyltransferase [Candidatus Omnitrophota bacterium]